MLSSSVEVMPHAKIECRRSGLLEPAAHDHSTRGLHALFNLLAPHLLNPATRRWMLAKKVSTAGGLPDTHSLTVSTGVTSHLGDTSPLCTPSEVVGGERCDRRGKARGATL